MSILKGELELIKFWELQSRECWGDWLSAVEGKKTCADSEGCRGEFICTPQKAQELGSTGLTEEEKIDLKTVAYNMEFYVNTNLFPSQFCKSGIKEGFI